MRATKISITATMWREDWGCAAGVPEVVGLRGAEVAEEEMFARCLSLLASLWRGRGRGKEWSNSGRGGRVKERSEQIQFCYGSMYPQLVVLWRKLVQLILQHPNCTLSGGQVGGSEIMQWWLTTCKLKTLTASICAFSTSACRLWRSKQMDNTELCL